MFRVSGSGSWLLVVGIRVSSFGFQISRSGVEGLMLGVPRLLEI